MLLTWAVDVAARYAPQNLTQMVATVMQRLDGIDGQLQAQSAQIQAQSAQMQALSVQMQAQFAQMQAQFAQMQDSLTLTNAITLNHKTIARNKKQLPICEPLRKTVFFFFVFVSSASFLIALLGCWP